MGQWLRLSASTAEGVELLHAECGKKKKKKNTTPKNKNRNRKREGRRKGKTPEDRAYWKRERINEVVGGRGWALPGA